MNTIRRTATIFLLAVFAAVPAVLYAQQAPSAFDTAKQAYIRTLNTYREKEQQFSIAHEQYLQLKTLASLDIAVSASKDVQLARIDTLTSYVQALLTSLSDLKGIDLEKKSQQQQVLQNILTDLQARKVSVQNAQDKIALDAVSTEFSTLQNSLTSAAYTSLALSKIAAMQYAIDQITVVSNAMHKTFTEQNASAAAQTEKERGFDELKRTLDSATLLLQKTADYVDQSIAAKALGLSSYVRVVNELNTVYAKVRQAESFVKELAQ